ncbi:bifunctional (p)ppGpp synthetase/guanosine-3',5'-bis(diphosphate) 3'-pyrophosphohydrolase [Ignavibacteria bacterium]|nr:bifunctional (p)ppGpp synthetase/guanosine-3',5'-bis(diphosphate) 3'-pyrophosphohydrolase [Bacteroidota bacterium]
MHTHTTHKDDRNDPRALAAKPQFPRYSPGKDPEADLAYLLTECKKHLPKPDEDIITRAFRFCLDAHRNNKRASGEPYYVHLFEVALIVARELILDDISVAAALLHDVVEDNESYAVKDIAAQFGPAVAQIVDGVTKITDISQSREITQAESYRKLLLSLAKDLRVILIKFADRLHNMRTLDHLPPEKQRRIAQETLDIYAPFAHRFGLGQVKWELEDLAFKFLHRKEYDEIKRSLKETRRSREDYIRRFAEPIRKRLDQSRLKYEISGRPKHIFSIYNKMQARQKGIDELYDLFAVRIILDEADKNECFLIYGIVTEIYTPVPERFKDYISVPKKNGYQSLHTTVIGADGRRIEVQIRTHSMHEVAEKGVAAHFLYKAETLGLEPALADNDFEYWINWMRNIREYEGEEMLPQLMESFKLNLFPDEIHVFTPKGDIRKLPAGATPVDFAFDIHTKVGSHAIGAKVNGRIAPLDEKLQNGDEVEIITSKNPTTTRNWERFVVTHKAKSQIRRFFNEEKRQKTIEGRTLWERKSKKAKINIGEDELERIVVSLKYENKSEFYYALGSGTANIDIAIDVIKARLKSGATQLQLQSEVDFNVILHTARQTSGGVYLTGTAGGSADIVFTYAKCCNPIPGDDIIGVVITGRGIKVHRKLCKNMQHRLVAGNDDRIMPLEWASNEQGEFIAALRVAGDDRPGMLHDITNAIVSYKNTNIRNINISAAESVFEGVVTVFVRNTEHLSRLFERLRKIRGVKTAERFEG